MKHANGKLDVCEIMRNLRTVIYYTCIISKIVKLIFGEETRDCDSDRDTQAGSV